MLLNLVELISIVLTALVLGVFWGPWLALSRSMASFEAPVFLAIAHRMNRNLASTMTVLMPLALVSIVAVLVLTYTAHPLSVLLTLAGFVLFVVTLLVTGLIEVPIVQKIATWTVPTLPRVAAVNRVPRDPTPWPLPHLAGPLKQRPGQRAFGLQRGRGRYARSLTAFGVIDPQLGHIQVTVEQCITKRRSVGQKDANLTVADLAQCAGILASDADRMRTLFGSSRLINDEDACGTAQAGAEEALQGSNDGAGRPGCFSEETLQGAGRGLGNRFGDVLGVAAVRMLDEEATQILLAAALGFAATEQRGEVLMEASEGVGDPIQVFWCHKDSSWC